MSKIVTFPGLGLEFELNPIAFSVFGWDVHWYGVIIACGFLLAVAYCYWRAPRFGVDQEKLIDMLFFAVPLCIIGARAYYVIFNPAVCFNADCSFSLYNTIAIWDGGLAIYGAIIMAILTVAVYCKVRRQNFWDYTDIGCFGVLIGQLVGRWGNFVNVEAFGGVTDLPWRMCSPSIADYLLQHGLVDEAAYQQVLDGTLGVHPTFFYESMWNLLGFILLVLIARKGRKFNGQLFLSYVVWYGVGRAVIEGLRTDSLYFFGTGLRSSQILGLASALVAIVVMAFRFRTAGPPTPPSYAAVRAEKGTAATPEGENGEVPAGDEGSSQTADNAAPEGPDTQEKTEQEDDGNGSDPDGR